MTAGYSYDYSRGLLKAKSFDGNNGTYFFDYNKEDQISRITDYDSNESWFYGYDAAGRLQSATGRNGEQMQLSYDERGNTKSVYAVNDGELWSSAEYTYKADGLFDGIKLHGMNEATATYTHDALGRQGGLRLYARPGNTNDYFYQQTTYLWKDEASKNRTAIPNEIWYRRITGKNEPTPNAVLAHYGYTYDAKGNVQTVRESTTNTNFDWNGSSGLQTLYYYDSLNQLTAEEHVTGVASTEATTYTYDSAGNITRKKTDGNDAINYTYGNTNWKDQLTAYDGKAIAYDKIGNPTSYDGYSFAWKQGRVLASIKGNGANLNFSYNSDGLRTKKYGATGGDAVFTYLGDTLIAQTVHNNYYLGFVYDAAGNVLGFRYGTYNAGVWTLKYYYYILNAFGDVLGIFDDNQNIIARYQYDSWGKLLSVKNASGANITDQNHIANRNPLRYRGYYYDTETKLYYCGARYYNPEWGRWLNADSALNLAEGQTGMNLYQYCGNNPINREDPGGDAWWHWAIGAAIVVGCAAAVVMTAGGAVPALMAVAGAINGAAVAVSTSTAIATGAFIGSATVYGTLALSASANSTSVKEFNDQGNWLTVGATAGGALFGGGSAWFDAREPRKFAIGENMKGNVIPKANEHGFKTYGGLKSYSKIEGKFGPSVAGKVGMAHNKLWIEKEKMLGSQFYDFGPRGSEITSPFYAMERKALQNYPYYARMY
jgi:RHS repeat-associated protein